MPWCASCDKFLSPNSVSVVGTCPTCGIRVEDSEGRPARSQKVPWHFQLFFVAAVIYLGWRLLEGIIALLN